MMSPTSAHVQLGIIHDDGGNCNPGLVNEGKDRVIADMASIVEVRDTDGDRCCKREIVPVRLKPDLWHGQCFRGLFFAGIPPVLIRGFPAMAINGSFLPGSFLQSYDLLRREQRRDHSQSLCCLPGW